MLEGCPF